MVAMSTDWPLQSCGFGCEADADCGSRIVPSRSSPQLAFESRPTTIPVWLPAAAIHDARQAGLVGGIFIEADEVAKCDREACVFVVAEGVCAERVFKTGDDDRKAERIQPA